MNLKMFTNQEISSRIGQRSIFSKNVVGRNLAEGAVDDSAIASSLGTNLNTANTLVKRDASGNFSCNIITGRTTGNENPLTFSSPLSRSVNTISLPQASASANGYLSSTDWSNFNSKVSPSSGIFTGEVALTTLGTKLHFAVGTNAAAGSATLVAGTVTISTTAVTANSLIFLTVNTASAALGTPYISAIVDSTSFTISSSNGADTSVINWLIIEPI